MFNLDIEKIARIIHNPKYLQSGVEYYNNGRVRSLDYNPKNQTVEAQVKGTNMYEVSIYFDNEGVFDDAYCTCPLHEDYGEYCKHIAAVLFTVERKQGVFEAVADAKKISNISSTFDSKDHRNRQAVQSIFNSFQSPSSSVKAEGDVNLEISLEFSSYTRSSHCYLTFRIGTRKLYVVKNMEKLIEAIKNGRELEFGKQFTLDPFVHRFKDEDWALINMIMELYEIDSLGDRRPYGFYNRDSKLFYDKQVVLPSSFRKRFFDIMGDRSFRFNLNGREYDSIAVTKQDMPISLYLSKDDSDLLLKIEKNGEVIPLTDDGQFFFYDGAIYKPSKKQRQAFIPFYNAFQHLGGNAMKFDKDSKEKFISEILPITKNVGKIEIDKGVEQSFYNVPLRSELYIDRIDKGITVEIRFKYGDRVINPFAKDNKAPQDDDRIVIRDVEGERKVLELLEDESFKVMPQRLYIEREEDIFDFIYLSIPNLQQHAEIFYSEKFKSTPIREISSFKGGIRLNQQSDLLEFSFDMEGIDRELYSDIFNSIRERKKFFRLPDGSFLPLESKELQGISDIVEYLDLDDEDFQRDVVRISKYRASYLDDKIKELELSSLIERNTRFKQLVQNINEPKDMDFEIPENLRSILRDYQKTGFKWFKTLDAYGFGGILADDMGLGKTLQTIAFLKSQISIKTEPALIVAPTSLVYNWKAEIEKFSPDLKSLVISGDKGEREELFKEIEGQDVVITSYPLIRRDIESYRDIKFSYCILDEAQHIKNPNSLNARSVKEIVASNYFALTGTPIENSLTELWSIFDFIMPGYLLNHGKFTNRFERPIVKNGDNKAMEELKKHIRPFILRRIKKDVLKELPDKVEHGVTAELSKEQKKIYLTYLSQIKNDINNEIKEKGFEKSHIKILAGLTRLRQICCHPSLFIDDYRGDSGKLELLEEIISEAMAGGHRMLIFSQFTSMLAIIKERLQTLGLRYLYLDGSTDTQERGKLVNRFNEGKDGDIFLISLKAGGTGLNLTGADTVVHFDPWWNPAVEDQASDRAHRIGQKKSVHVMKLIAKGTIEEKIFNLQQKKREMIENVIKPGETLLTKLKEEEIRELFDLDNI